MFKSDPDDVIYGNDPYGPLAEHIIFRGISAAELAEIAEFKEGMTFSDIKRKLKEKGVALSHGKLVANFIDVLKETVNLKPSL
ncbi:hypothetical protein KKB71_00725 [Patescibacteria group bacterium]|nr:hypothetical protein [Patescibacteria group bacterium]MBU2263406.1 hypothetical protein [Patescibacteria group bacterium]